MHVNMLHAWACYMMHACAWCICMMHDACMCMHDACVCILSMHAPCICKDIHACVMHMPCVYMCVHVHVCVHVHTCACAMQMASMTARMDLPKPLAKDLSCDAQGRTCTPNHLASVETPCNFLWCSTHRSRAWYGRSWYSVQSSEDLEPNLKHTWVSVGEFTFITFGSLVSHWYQRVLNRG
jgi:hypothetical protein